MQAYTYILHFKRMAPGHAMVDRHNTGPEVLNLCFENAAINITHMTLFFVYF